MHRGLYLTALALTVGVFTGMAACSDENTTTGPKPATDSGVSDSGAPPADSSDDDTSAPTDSTPADAGDAGKCPGSLKEGTIAELRDKSSSKAVIVNDGVKLTGVVATSRKWLTRKPKNIGDSCLYAVFVADTNSTFQPWSGIEVMSYGKNAEAADDGKAICKWGTDLIPDDIKPGDLADLAGTYTEFGPTAANCGGATPPQPLPNPPKMPQVFKLCEFTRNGTGAVPAAATVTPAQISQGSTELLQWAGGRVRIENVTAGADVDFGAFPIAGSSLVVGDDIYFNRTSTEKVALPTVKKDDQFDSITGLVLLDYCTWSLQTNACEDMVAKSGFGPVCGSIPGSDAGPDAADADGGDDGASDAAGD